MLNADCKEIGFYWHCVHVTPLQAHISCHLKQQTLCHILNTCFWSIFSSSPTFRRKQHGGHAFCFLLHNSGILFFLLSVTALAFLPSKLALKLTSSNSVLTSNSFSAAHICDLSGFRSLWTSSAAFKQVFKMRKHICACIHSLLALSAPNPMPVYVRV